jgi:hypothetical protein
MVAYGAIRTPGHADSAPVSTSRRTYTLLACGLALAGFAAAATQQRSSGVQDNYGENTASTASNWRDAAWVTATVKQQAGNTTDHPCATICDPKECRSDADAQKPVCKKCAECHNAHNKGGGKDGGGARRDKSAFNAALGPHSDIHGNPLPNDQLSPARLKQREERKTRRKKAATSTANGACFVCGGPDHVRAQCSAWRQWKKDTNNDAHIEKAWSGSIEKKLITASSPQQVACVARSSRDPKYAADATGETKAVWDAGH